MAFPDRIDWAETLKAFGQVATRRWFVVLCVIELGAVTVIWITGNPHVAVQVLAIGCFALLGVLRSIAQGVAAERLRQRKQSP